VTRAGTGFRKGRGGDGRGGPDEAGDRVLGGEPDQVGQGEQGLGADHRGEVLLELGEPGRVGVAQRVVERRQGLLDQAEAKARPGGRLLRAGDGGRDHGADGGLRAEHATQQELAGEADPLDRIAGARHRAEGLRRAGPHPVEGLVDQGSQVREVAIGRGLRDERHPRDVGHGHGGARADELAAGLDDRDAGALLLVDPPGVAVGRHRHAPFIPSRPSAHASHHAL
jgi:hypothetical protein